MSRTDVVPFISEQVAGVWYVIFRLHFAAAASGPAGLLVAFRPYQITPERAGFPDVPKLLSMQWIASEPDRK